MINDGKDRNETAWGVQPTPQEVIDEFDFYALVNKVDNHEGILNYGGTCENGYTPHIKHSGWFRQVN